MSVRNQIAKLRQEIGKARGADEVREISRIMDELSAAAAGGAGDPPATLEQIMDQSEDEQE
jgi:hypothetical protein